MLTLQRLAGGLPVALGVRDRETAGESRDDDIAEECVPFGLGD
jgi:hypothetical protein